MEIAHLNGCKIELINTYPNLSELDIHKTELNLPVSVNYLPVKYHVNQLLVYISYKTIILLVISTTTCLPFYPRVGQHFIYPLWKRFS